MTGRSTAVLVVGDDRETASFLESSLSTVGFEVTMACNGIQAIEELHSRQFDVIIADFKMPRLGGEELYAAMEKEMPWSLRTICFLLSDHHVSGVRSFLAKTGARFLQKPFSFDQIAGVINEILNEHQPKAAPCADC
jgi:DNA-binding NtrC family response regulator